MLEQINIAGFRRIGLIQLDLTQPITCFFGFNEAGKSSIAEAIDFALTGESDRYSRKGDFPNLVTFGKKKGIVQIRLNGLDIRRELPSGKLTSAGTLDLNPQLVRIQLGRESFVPDDPKKITERRKMLNELLHLSAPDELIVQRLQERGIGSNVIDKVMPLVRGGNFQAAEEEAKSKASNVRGQWEEVTGEKYGHVKAEDWKPEDIERPCPTETEIAAAETVMQKALTARDVANHQLSKMAEDLRRFESMDEDPKTIEEWEQVVADAQELLNEHTDILTECQDEFRAGSEQHQNTIHELDLKLVQAKAAASTLVCPCCNQALNIVSREKTTVLVKAESDRTNEDAAQQVQTLVESLRVAREDFDKFKRESQIFIEGARQDVTKAQINLGSAEASLASARALATTPRPTEAELQQKAQEFADANDAYDAAVTTLQDLSNVRNEYVKIRDKVDRANSLHKIAAQWAEAQKAFSNAADSIQSELASRLMKPINDALTHIAEPWGQVPVAMDPTTLKLYRIDQTPYESLSESAQWRADAMMQLMLATISTLKLVVLDRFDVLVGEQRTLFLEGLDAFSQEHPEISIVVMGSLKERPKHGMEGFSFYWIENGGIAA